MCNAQIIIPENIHVYFALKTKPVSKDKVEKFLSIQKNIVLHKLEFGFDFLCEGIFTDCADAESFFMTLFSNFRILKFDKYYISQNQERMV